MSKSIIVTGAGGGIGESIARQASSTGYKVGVLDVNKPVPIGRVTAALRAAIERIDVTGSARRQAQLRSSTAGNVRKTRINSLKQWLTA